MIILSCIIDESRWNDARPLQEQAIDRSEEHINYRTIPFR